MLYASPPVQKLHLHSNIISNYISLPFLQHTLQQCYNHLDILSSTVKISTSPHNSESILWTSTPVWTIPNSIIRLPSLLLLLSSSLSAKSSVAVPSAIQLYILHFKSKMASSCCNSSTSTPVSLLGTSFNTILHFSDHLAYPPNAP